MRTQFLIQNLIILTSSFNLTFSQGSVTKRTYYDYNKTKLRSEWQEAANGYINGFYKEYHANGKIYVDRIVKTDNYYPYWSTDLTFKEYDNSGNLVWSVKRNEKKQFEGEQVSFQFINGVKKIKSKAIFNSGNLQSFELYNSQGGKFIELIVGSSYKRYSNSGEIRDNISISKSGAFSGTLRQGKNDEIQIEVLNGKIQKVFEKNPTDNKKDWIVVRKDNDTLISSFNEEGFRYSKYYLDTTYVGLIKHPTINVDDSQWRENEIGLDFINQKYLCCMPSQKYFYNVTFYNGEYLKYIKMEKREITSEKLISISTPEKEIEYYSNGTLKKVFYSNRNWEEYDENGKVIDNYEISLLREYKNNYNRVYNNKLEMLRGSLGLSKYFFDLNTYRKNKNGFIFTNHSFYHPSSMYKPAYKVQGSNNLLLEEEAIALKGLLDIRSKILDLILVNSIDNAENLLIISSEKNEFYQVEVKPMYKNIYNAYLICTNHLSQNYYFKKFDFEPKKVLSEEYIVPEKINHEKDKEIINLLTDKWLRIESFDFDYIPSEWIEFNKSFTIWANEYTAILGKLYSGMSQNSSKLEKRLQNIDSFEQINKVLKKY
jgi:hypothetical protein